MINACGVFRAYMLDCVKQFQMVILSLRFQYLNCAMLLEVYIYMYILKPDKHVQIRTRGTLPSISRTYGKPLKRIYRTFMEETPLPEPCWFNLSESPTNRIHWNLCWIRTFPYVWTIYSPILTICSSLGYLSGRQYFVNIVNIKKPMASREA